MTDTVSTRERQRGLQPPGSSLAPRVFYPAGAIVITFVLVAAIFPETLNTIVSTAGSSVIDGLGWYYVLLTFGFVVFSIWIAVSRFGDITLGKDDEAPEFGLKSWFAMLFSAGMGIGLMFWGVAEPLFHYASPPPGVEGSSADVANAAMGRTFLHWGVHAWAIYVVVGLAVAYAVHRRGLPVSIRWALEPLLGDRVKGWVGDLIDIVAVVGTLFGVATSLGFGVSQVGAGMEFTGLVSENTAGLQVLLIAAITVIATLSVASGIGHGIRWLSNINLGLAGILLLTVVVVGPTLFLFREFVQSIGYYLQNFLSMSFSTLPYQGEPGESWLGGWTTYYWGWWMSWSPFVGIFIARISRGRTIREFIAGVLLVPTMLTMAWFVGLGGTALYQEVVGEGGIIAADGSVSADTALFQMLDGLPGGAFLSGMALVMIVIFFVTSSDSGSFVVDMIANGGNPDPPMWSRVFWAVLEGSIAAVLIWSAALTGSETGGLAALQTMAILVAAPFTLVMVLACFATVRALRAEHKEITRLEHALLRREIALEAAGAVASGDLDTSPAPVGAPDRREDDRHPG
ncbi:BCCT family transporter [Ornithinimicrobium sediminis]|uniref:BCCT family transporter n=1 Tax=Ornithinimicrobium sediminis TaxID=2904603 RepID=UPI001E60F801|nr:BCCT family transporter [Ornithinimicrobium sediminis]